MEVKPGTTSLETGHACLFSNILPTLFESIFMKIPPLTLVIIKYARQLKILSNAKSAEASIDKYKSS